MNLVGRTDRLGEEGRKMKIRVRYEFTLEVEDDIVEDFFAEGDGYDNALEIIETRALDEVRGYPPFVEKIEE